MNVMNGLDDKTPSLQRKSVNCMSRVKMKSICIFNAYTSRTTKSPEMDHGSQTLASRLFPLGVSPWIDTSTSRVLA